jgi:Kelch motif
MKKLQNNSPRTSVLKITFSLGLIFVSAILLASGFKLEQKWSWSAAGEATEMEFRNADQAHATLGNTTYAFSGASDGVLTTASYKTDGKTWTPIAPYPVPTKSSSAVSDGARYIYIMNGINSSLVYQTATFRYDPITDSYTQMASNTVGTQNQAAVYAEGKIYKMGGKNAGGYQIALEIYDIATNTWSLGTSLPTAKPFGGAWAQDNFIYTALNRYDIATNTWSSDVPTATWTNGDVFAGVGNGSYKVFDNAGNFKETITSGASNETTGCSFNPSIDKLYTTHFGANRVIVFDDIQPHNVLQTIIPIGGTSTESVVFDAAGNFYIGHADGIPKIEKYDSVGNFVTSYNPTVGPRGADWIDLAADQKTIFYSSEGTLVRRFDVSTNTQLTDFANVGGLCFALRLLPPGDGSGGLLVANWTSGIQRLDSSGNIVQTYTAGSAESFFALNLDPNGTSFWSAGYFTGNIYRFNIATGAVELSFNGAPFNTLAGLCVSGEIVAAVSPTPTPTGTPSQTPTPAPTPTVAATATATVAPTQTPQPTETPQPSETPRPTPTSSPTSLLSISGTISYCSNPALPPVPGVTMTLTGSSSDSTLTHGSGNYTFSQLPSGGNYTVTPTKTALVPGSAGINTLDVIAIQRHFLNLGTPLTGCKLTAADVNGVGGINTLDVIAVQRFFLSQVTGIANVGKYKFIPVNRIYSGIGSNQTGQNYDTLVFGDVASPFAE